tara:strand:- start:62 stop:355 length:294 start_codon:yes stop_codon:yes gene_type:complete
MATVATITWVRPNTGVDWYVPSNTHKAYIKTNFRDNGKLSTSTTVSDDELTRTSVSTFTNYTVREEWKADSKVQEHLTARDTYNTNNSINEAFSMSS